MPNVLAREELGIDPGVNWEVRPGRPQAEASFVLFSIGSHYTELSYRDFF